MSHAFDTNNFGWDAAKPGKLCTMHQMREVNYFYHELQHHIREIYISAPSESSTIAVKAAQEVTSALAFLSGIWLGKASSDKQRALGWWSAVSCQVCRSPFSMRCWRRRGFLRMMLSTRCDTVEMFGQFSVVFVFRLLFFVFFVLHWLSVWGYGWLQSPWKHYRKCLGLFQTSHEGLETK